MAPLPQPATQLDVTIKPSDNSIQTETWFIKQWRPLAAYTYLLICLFDFMLAPIGMGVLAVITKTAYVAWVPLTIQGASMFHLSFGAIIGLYSWGRTKEKIAGVGTEPADEDQDNDPRPSRRRNNRAD